MRAPTLEPPRGADAVPSSSTRHSQPAPSSDYGYAHDPLTTPSPQGIMVAWFIGALTIVALYLLVFAPAAPANKHSDKTGDDDNNNNNYPPVIVSGNNTNGAAKSSVTVIAWHAPSKDWQVWTAQKLKDYENDCHRLLEDYSRLMETIHGYGTAERLLSSRWQHDLQRIELYAREQQATLTDILQQPFTFRLALPSSAAQSTVTNTTLERPEKCPTNTPPVRLPPNAPLPDQSYDGMSQILAHLVRDWSDEGQTIRASLYDWCLARIPSHRGATTQRILVPGAGLGRLAWELSQRQQQGSIVHAVELSWSMMAVFVAMAGQTATATTPKQWKIYPFLNDFWTNQVSSETRFHAVYIPDVSVDNSNKGRLLWTVADFVELSQLPEEAASYDVIVTCFFLDTAANVLEYIDAMQRLLRRGGLWINVGPLHWHSNARIVLTAEDLRALLNEGWNGAWKILEWSIDTEPLEYRSITVTGQKHQQHRATTATPSTRYEAYRPLRFVVKKVA